MKELAATPSPASIRLLVIDPAGDDGPVPAKPSGHPDQPHPIYVQVMRLDWGNSIVRGWEPGDAARCRLCERCRMSPGHTYCVVFPDRPITDEEAALYSSVRPKLAVIAP